MVQKLILTGTADKGNGDPLRTAFIKVNDNFTELFNHVSAGVAAGATAPTDPGEGDLWWDSTSGRLYVYYGTAWVDASPEDGAGISSTNELVNGAHTVSLASTGVLTLPDGLTIDSSVIGYNSSDTISEETPGGTVSQTTVQESQVEIDATSIVIARRTTLTVDDTVITTTDTTSNTLGVNNSSAFMKRIADPEGPTNSSYFQVSTSNSGAVMEGVDETVGGTSYGKVTATQGAVEIITSDSTVTNGWAFSGSEITFNGDSGSYIIDGSSNNFEVRSGNNINFEAFNEANIYTRDGEKQWIFNNNGDLVLPAKWPVNFTAVFDADHYTGGGTFTGDGTASLTIELAGAGTEFAWAADDPVYETDLGYVGQQQFSFTAADHGITGYTLEITMEMISGEGYSIQPALSEPPSVVDLAKIRSSEELMIKAGAKGWLFDVQGNIYLPPSGSVRDRDSKLAFNENGGTNVYLTPTTDDSTAVFVNTTSVQAYATESVSLQVGSAAADLEDLWIGVEAVWVEVRDLDAADIAPATRAWAGLPSYQAYDIILNTFPVEPAAPGNLVPVANDAKNAYNTWQLALGNVSGVSISASSNEWVFNPSGILTLNNGVAEIYADPIDGSVRISDAAELTAPSTHLILGGADAILTIQGGPPSKIWRFTGAGGLEFPNTTVQTTAYIPPTTTGNSVISSGSTTISRNGMTIRITAVGVVQMSFDSVINIKGRSSINNAGSTVIASPNGATVISTWYDIGAALAEGDQLVATIMDSSYHNVYRITVLIREQNTTPGSEQTVAYAIIEQIQ